MSIELKMPALSPTMEEGTLTRWLVKEGDTVSSGDIMAEIETDKATVEVESSASGVVLQQIVDEGAVVPVNAPIAIVGAEGCVHFSSQPHRARWWQHCLPPDTTARR